MKKQLLTVFAAFAISTCANAQVIMTESFESPTFPPAGWSIFNNGTGNDWDLFDQDPTLASQGQQSMFYIYSQTDAADAWAFSAPLNLVMGDSIVITFDYLAIGGTTYPESLKLTMGTGQNVAAQTAILWDEPNVANDIYQSASVGVKILANGTYNLGFNCYSAADMYGLFVDNISVRKVLPSDLRMNVYAGTTRSCSFSTGEEITVSFENIGSADEVNFPVAFSVNGAVTSENVSTPVPAGTSASYTFTGTANFATPGTYNVKIYTQLGADGDRSNDTIAFTVTSDATGLMTKTSLDTAFIPDNDTVGGVISELPFCGIANNLGTNIRINRLIIESIAHTYPDDLRLTLISPNGGDSLILADQIGADNVDYPMITFTDTALTNIIIFDEDPILTGYYQPQEAPGFAKFDGQDPNGVWKLWITDDAGADIGYLTSWTLEFDNAVGVKELKTVNNLITVYPNPNNGIFTVRSSTNGSVKAEILSLNGQLVDTFSLNGKSAQQTVDLHHLAKGMYFVKAIGENGVQTDKIIIE
ncbi:MAG: hypothetical protein K0S33_4109 [Bacteroidetes bacterium]|jgi:subtilisin-like proprotein convertase family protein|nr:hypothetical protein [Bacteroidota bacterium]